MARDLLTWETNNSLTYPLNEKGRVLRYFENWQQLVLEMYEFEVFDFQRPFEHKLKLDPIPGDDWRAITDEGRPKYFQHRKAEIIAGEPGGPMIMGTARLVKSELEVGGVSGGFERNEGDPTFRMSFHELPVYIRSAEEDQYGEIRFSHAYEDSPAALYLNLNVRKDRMEQLVETILTSPRSPKIDMTVRALLFQDEVERSLNPLWASDTYFLPDYPGGSLAVATFINAKYAVAAPRPTEDDDDFVEPLEDAEPKPTPTDLNPEAMHLLKRINQALWALVGMVAVFIVTRAF